MYSNVLMVHPAPDPAANVPAGGMGFKWGARESSPSDRHCEERKRRSNPFFSGPLWIASLSLSSGAHSRDPVVRNDDGDGDRLTP
jgi:hypothetical protein